MRVLLIHQAFASPHEPGGTRHFELARACVALGHWFTIVASPLSYLTGRRWPVQAASGGIEEYDGVHVRRAWAHPSLHRGFFWRLFSFLSFMVSAVVESLRAGPADLVMGTSPPLFQAFSAWLTAALRRRPFLLEIRDLWPEFAVDLGVLTNPLLIGLARRGERFLYARASHLVVNSPAYADYLVKKGVPRTKVTLVPNGTDPDLFQPEADGARLRRELGLEGRFVLTYAGALGPANDIPTIIHAAGLLRDRPEFRFLLVGDGQERPALEAMVREMNLTNVTFTGSRPKREMPEFLAASDACLATLKDIPMFRTTYPNKVFDYMAAGRPTLLAIDGVIREVMDRAEGGIFVRPGRPEDLAQAAVYLREHPEKAREMGRAARSYVVRHFHRRVQAHRFARTIARAGRMKRQTLCGWWVKRLGDVLVSSAALVILSPLLLVLAGLVRIFMGSPALFTQARPGLGGRPFRLYKFRTMTDARDREGNPLPDGKRLTRFGRFLRRTSLDELPELYNVLKGDMSLVGPRPLLMEYLDRYDETQARRHEVKPGITGWAQVNGRNVLTWEEKFALDVWYVDHQNLFLDLKILGLTLWRAARGGDINQPGRDTAEKFMGPGA
ncbi:MAG: sugar transferase [Thermodesulfobacteriota bacterium]